MRFILDTNAVSALMRGDAAVVARLRSAARSDVFIPQPVLAEISYGIQRLPRSKKRELLAARLEMVKEEIGRAVWNDEVSEAFGAVKSALERKGEQIEDFDVAIAAHAMSEGFVLVTANVKHLARVPGVHIEDWSKDEG